MKVDLADDDALLVLIARLTRAAKGAVQQAVDAHGPLTRANMESAEKRIYGAIRQSLTDYRDGR